MELIPYLFRNFCNLCECVCYVEKARKRNRRMHGLLYNGSPIIEHSIVRISSVLISSVRISSVRISSIRISKQFGYQISPDFKAVRISKHAFWCLDIWISGKRGNTIVCNFEIFKIILLFRKVFGTQQNRNYSTDFDTKFGTLYPGTKHPKFRKTPKISKQTKFGKRNAHD